MRHLAVMISMNGYAGVGSLARTLDVYRKFASNGWDVTFFTSERTNKNIKLDFDARIIPQFPYNLPEEPRLIITNFFARVMAT